jgi:hypothetical protein
MSSKANECDFSVRNKTGRCIETLQILPTWEHNSTTAYRYKYFPKGQQIKRSPTSSKNDRRISKGISDTSLVLIKPRFQLYAERTMHFYMPQLTFNRSAEATSKGNRCTSCPFVSNNKSYLKKKGLNINDLYSFRHRHIRTNNNITLDDRNNFQMSKLNSTDLQVFLKRRSTITKHDQLSGKSEFDDSSELVIDSPTLVKLMRGLERDTKTPGYIRADGSNRNILGKVITKVHQHNLLNQKEAVIPEVFYYKS